MGLKRRERGERGWTERKLTDRSGVRTVIGHVTILWTQRPESLPDPKLNDLARSKANTMPLWGICQVQTQRVLR